MTRSAWAGVFFDLDGTLADTVELILRSYRHTMRTHLGGAPPDELWLEGLGTPLRDQLRGFARDAHEARTMLETYLAYQRETHDDLVGPFDGVADLLAATARSGSRVAVVTSKTREMALRTVRRCGFEEAVECLVTADDVRSGKPDPEPVERALEALGLEEHRQGVIFLGDSPWDIRAGRAARVRTAGALWGPFSREKLELESPDYLVARPADFSRLTP